MKSTEPDPDLIDELYESLDALAAAAKELKRAKAAIFPAVRAKSRATKRVLDIWRQCRGGKRPPPELGILDIIEARNGHANGNGIHVDEELPDGGPAPKPTRKTRRKPGPFEPASTAIAAAPPAGWDPAGLLSAARLILGAASELDPDQLNELVICDRCASMRRLPTDGSRFGPSACPACGAIEWHVYSLVAGEFERRQEQMRPAPKRRRKTVSSHEGVIR
jgi:hypothetical protein